jgi:hypothetical protein
MKRSNPEGRIQLQIIHYLKAKGFYVAKIKTKGSKIGRRFIFDPYQARGIADLIVFSPQLAFIEVKSKVGIQSLDQKHFQELCKEAGIPYILTNSLDQIMEVYK